MTEFLVTGFVSDTWSKPYTVAVPLVVTVTAVTPEEAVEAATLKGLKLGKVEK